LNHDFYGEDGRDNEEVLSLYTNGTDIIVGVGSGSIGIGGSAYGTLL
jgi:hypothetical protein